MCTWYIHVYLYVHSREKERERKARINVVYTLNTVSIRTFCQALWKRSTSDRRQPNDFYLLRNPPATKTSRIAGLDHFYIYIHTNGLLSIAYN